MVFRIWVNALCNNSPDDADQFMARVSTLLWPNQAIDKVMEKKPISARIDAGHKPKPKWMKIRNIPLPTDISNGM